MRRGGLADPGMIFFRLTSWELALLFFVVIFGATGLGVFLGHRVRHLSDTLKEPFGVLQAALLGLVALLLAFGLSLAVSRYETRRTNIVTEANTIGTTYLRAQTLAEPVRSRSLDLLVGYTRSAVRFSDAVPGSDEADAARAQEERIQRRLWSLAGDALDTAPIGQRAAPVRRDAQRDDRRGDRPGRVPEQPGADRRPGARGAGSALALGLLAAYLVLVGRGVFAVLLASALVAFLLLVTTDLDRPTRGMIQVPDTVLRDQLASMEEPPAATAPRSRSAR